MTNIMTYNYWYKIWGDKVGDELNLEDNFTQYNYITSTIIEIVKKEEYDKLDEMFKKRQLILENINKVNYSVEELKNLYLQYDIRNLEKILELEMKNKKEELLEKIKETQKRKVAMGGYNSLQSRAVFLSREL